MFEAESGNCFGDPAGFIEVDWLWAALGHSAESTAARTEIAKHHERCGLVMPAFADVGALGAFADGVETEGAGEALEGVVVFAYGSAGL